MFINKIHRNLEEYLPKCRSYIASQPNIVKDEFSSSLKYYKNNAKNGWQIGSKLAAIKNMGAAASFCTKIYYSASKTKIRTKDIPVLLGGAGAISPLPGGTVLGYGLGKVIHRIVKAFK